MLVSNFNLCQCSSTLGLLLHLGKESLGKSEICPYSTLNRNKVLFRYNVCNTIFFRCKTILNNNLDEQLIVRSTCVLPDTNRLLWNAKAIQQLIRAYVTVASSYTVHRTLCFTVLVSHFVDVILHKLNLSGFVSIRCKTRKLMSNGITPH